MKLALLNTTIATTNGVYEIEEISSDRAREVISDALANEGFDSFIGHPATAKAMAEDLGFPFESPRGQLVQEVGQVALVLKMNGRPPEGVLLTVEEMRKVGYCYKLMTRIK